MIVEQANTCKGGGNCNQRNYSYYNNL